MLAFSPYLLLFGIRSTFSNQSAQYESFIRTQEHVETNRVKLRELELQLKQASDANERANLEKDRDLALKNITANEPFLEKWANNPPERPEVSKGIAILPLLALGLIGPTVGTYFGWRHLRRMRRDRTKDGDVAAMFTALFVPITALFGAIVALIYVPVKRGRWEDPEFARSLGLSLALLTAFVVCLWVIRKVWTWSHHIAKKAPTVKTSTSRVWLSCLGVALLLGLGLIAMLFFYWRMAAGPAPSFTAPASASVSNNTDSTYCVFEGDHVQFILYHAGDVGTSTSSSSNAVNRSWTNDGVLSLLPSHQTVTFYRHAGDPNTLRLNGKVYRLDEGRVFLIGDTASIEQIEMNPPIVRDQEDLREFVESLRAHRQNQQTFRNPSHADPFEGKPEILCLQWQVGDGEQPVTWNPDGRLMDSPENLAFVDNIRLKNHQPGLPLEDEEGMDYQVLKFAVDHPAFDQSSSVRCRFYDSAGQSLSTSSSGGRSGKSAPYRFAALLRIPPPILKNTTLKLEASGGGWERRPERFLASSFDKRIRFREFDNVSINTAPKNVHPRPEFAVEVQVARPPEPHQLKVVAVLLTGERQDHVGTINAGVNSYEFERVTLEEVQAFEFYTRPLREFTYPDLPLMPYPKKNGLRG